MQNSKSARKRKTHRSVEFFIVHGNGRRSKTNAYDFKKNLDAGNLIQTSEQLRTESNVAFVCPGLVAYFLREDRRTERVFRVDGEVGGSMLVFEVADRITVEQIELQLLNQFRSVLERRILSDGRLANIDPSLWNREVDKSARRLAVAIVRERDLAKLRSRPSDWLQWLRGVIAGGFLPGNQAARLRAQSLPLIQGEPVIPGDPKSAFALY